MIMISPRLIRFDRRRYFAYMAVYISPIADSPRRRRSVLVSVPAE